MALTQYKEGSLRELWTLSFPLMLSSLSVVTMIFADRWLLAHYSTNAHNAAVTATTFGWAFIFAWVVLANISEVFVAQYNGAGLRQRLGEPVWQMIWLSISSVLFFIPFSYWGADWFFGEGPDGILERDYFEQMLFFGPFYPLGAALSGFFIGQGKTRLVTIVIIVANLINVILDQMLIFGIEGLVPSLGVKGAAIGTSVAMVLQVIVLGIFFLSKHHRQQHGTLEWRPKLRMIGECAKIGLPNAVFFMCEILAFAVFYALMRDKGVEYITITAICQTMLILFSFFGEGVNKATAALVGNFIGAGRSFFVPKVIVAGIKLNLLFFVCMVACFYYGTSFIIQQFLPTAEPAFISSIHTSLEICLFLMALDILFEGLRFQFAGVLTAAGDTLFLFLAGASLVWALMVLPVYVFVILGTGSVELACWICVIYNVAASLLYLLRIYQGKWRSIVISADLQS